MRSIPSTPSSQPSVQSHDHHHHHHQEHSAHSPFDAPLPITISKPKRLNDIDLRLPHTPQPPDKYDLECSVKHSSSKCVSRKPCKVLSMLGVVDPSTPSMSSEFSVASSPTKASNPYGNALGMIKEEDFKLDENENSLIDDGNTDDIEDGHDHDIGDIEGYDDMKMVEDDGLEIVYDDQQFNDPQLGDVDMGIRMSMEMEMERKQESPDLDEIPDDELKMRQHDSSSVRR